MILKIDYIVLQKRVFETASHYDQIHFDSMRNDAFQKDFRFIIDEKNIYADFSLNELRELRDSLNKLLPEKKHG